MFVRCEYDMLLVHCRPHAEFGCCSCGSGFWHPTPTTQGSWALPAPEPDPPRSKDERSE
jgi:hypothetical protein